MLKSDETSEAIEHFVDKQVDELLERRVGDMVKEKSFDRVLDFVENRVQRFTATDDFEIKVHEFVSGRLDDLAHSSATLSETFTPETIAFVKDRIDQQVPPIVHHLADIATSQSTSKRIGGLIKHCSKRSSFRANAFIAKLMNSSTRRCRNALKSTCVVLLSNRKRRSF
jgi:hypothetical protein